MVFFLNRNLANREKFYEDAQRRHEDSQRKKKMDSRHLSSKKYILSQLLKRVFATD
jgi:hypothetical protein